MNSQPQLEKHPNAADADGCAGAFGVPELLAPAGDWDCARAAIENGADAIYFGLEKFNARMRAHNFTESDLPALMAFLHSRGAKGYVTFNTLVFQNEMADAEQYARSIIAAGVDAAIVQDVGICRLIRQLSPDFPIHVSTQMTVTSAGGIEFARELGCNLVVLARECSLKEIAAIQAAEQALGPEVRAMPLEVFVHGALCVAYSGQCLTSEALGGRSANRGECAQACRMPYDLVSDGETVPLGDRKYLLSPQDLATVELLPELARLGVASLKIEGRLKAPEYVANITRIYRAALDRITPAGTGSASRAINNVQDPVDRSHRHRKREGESQTSTTANYEMEMAFSRGLYTGWFHGTNNQALVHGRFGKKRGVYLGAVAEVGRDSVLLPLEAPLKPGDGVVFDADDPENPEEGGRVYGIAPVQQRSSNRVKASTGGTQLVRMRFGLDDINFGRIHVGDRVWKTSDPELERRLRQTFAGDTPHFQRPVATEVHGCAGSPLTLIVRDEAGFTAMAQSAMPLVSATTQPLTTERLRDQLGRLGGTQFKLARLDNHLEGEVLVPIGELNRMRRQAVADLVQLRSEPKRWRLNQSPALEPLVKVPQPTESQTEPELVVMVRNDAQLEAAVAAGIQTLYCEFEDPKKYRDAVARFRALNGGQGGGAASIWVAPPRIHKTGEEWVLKQVRSCEADGYLVRNYDHLKFFAPDRCIGDYSLNVANSISAHYFKDRFGLEWVTASYDLNFSQLQALLGAAPPEWFEITIHQHMPMFHMEHCVFCAFLSEGTDYRNCGRPCDRHEVKLRDRVGAQHPVKADAGCRNTVFNAVAQTGAEHVERMVGLGVRHFRLEFLNEPAELVRGTIAKYRQLLQGEISGSQVWRDLKLFNQLGVTRGTVSNVRR